MREHHPKHPIYVVSKGRSNTMLTSRALTTMGIQHFVIVEPQEVEVYAAAVAEWQLLTTILPLDLTYKATYELCDSFGQTRSTGPGPARNFAWDHSIASGAKWHHVADDNISGFYRLHKNKKVKCLHPGLFRSMEDFCERYANVAMGGPNYTFFVPPRVKQPPYFKNVRIYSFNLIRNDVPYRWRGRYNEDSILSIDMLKGGWCTIEFNAFLQAKAPTQSMGGGNTAEFYHREGIKGDGPYADGGTTAKSQMLAKVHPDVARVAWRYGRVHHQIDYRPFKLRQLRLRKGLTVPDAPNNYGMTLQHEQP